jgi:hypothetical protein
MDLSAHPFLDVIFNAIPPCLFQPAKPHDSANARKSPAALRLSGYVGLRCHAKLGLKKYKPNNRKDDDHCNSADN